MSTVMTWQTESTSSDATEKLAEQLGKQLQGGEVIELASDLGGGKTTFVRGLVRGMCSTDKVSSPSFTVSKVYQADKLQVHHFDFYRLHEAGLLEHELDELMGEKDVVVVVEWADVIQHVLPGRHLRIQIKTTGESTRLLTFEYPQSLSYIMEAIC